MLSEYLETEPDGSNSRKELQSNKFYLLKDDVIDFWQKPSLKHKVEGKAMVPPSHFGWFEKQLNNMNIEKNIYIDDVYECIILSEDTNKTFRIYLKEHDTRQARRNDEDDVFSFDGYHRFDQVLNYMKGLNGTSLPGVDVEFVEAGYTDENRTLAYLRINSKTSEEGTQRPIVIIEAGVNPREWITIPTALNIANKLIEGNQTKLAQNLEWIILPVLNPDGYEFTHNSNRLWTKSRSTRSNLGFICPGVNINRNFDIDWMFSDSSTSPCSHLYGGIESFSEPESQIIRKLIEEHGNRIKLYISLQNNGGFVSYPWQYERAASGMFRQHHLLGLEMISAIADNYKLDIGSLALGDRASGTSSDYVMSRNVLYTFNIDIKQCEGDVLVPEAEIRPIAERVWRAVAVAAGNMIS
nr:carboxypeptidase B-like [Danaus plexippus plexippus]